MGAIHKALMDLKQCGQEHAIPTKAARGSRYLLVTPSCSLITASMGLYKNKPTSLLGLFGMSAPCQRPLMQMSRKLELGVLEYRRFHESRIILLGGNKSRGFFGLGAGLGSSSPAAAAGASCR